MKLDAALGIQAAVQAHHKGKPGNHHTQHQLQKYCVYSFQSDFLIGSDTPRSLLWVLGFSCMWLLCPARKDEGAAWATMATSLKNCHLGSEQSVLLWSGMTRHSGRQRTVLRREVAKPLDLFNNCRAVYQKLPSPFGFSNLAARKVQPVTLRAFENFWAIHSFHHQVAKLVALVRLVIAGWVILSSTWLVFGTCSLESNDSLLEKNINTNFPECPSL